MLGIGKGKSPGHGQHAVETLVGPRAVIRGDVNFTGGLYVEGTIHGKVVADEGSAAVLTIADKGRIEGEVRAPVVVINGHMQGDVYASERVELAANARVQGNIHYKVVEMAAGAMITGRLIHADAPLAQLTGPDTAPAPAPAGRVKARGEAQEA
ncbi:MAG TPA: cell shape determination protein CcmA [Arenimonas sp.]|nr:MAG: cell shape determination protein CcmA [Xanthomonadales bacterium GWF1_69_6]HBD18799.1 cell shape determination protein CcmA [Arenimonas sp.]